MSISFNPGVNPDDYAKTYAAQNNMSVEDAKQELKTKHGDPDKNNASIFDTTSVKGGNNAETDESRAAAAMSNIDPDVFAQQFANENGMSLDEAIKELEEKLGIPQKPGLSEIVGNFVGGLVNFINGAVEKMSPENQSTNSRPDPSTDPDAYVRIYANEHNLTFEEAKAELEEKYGKFE